ncbi:MAG: hypothetical protein ACI85K_001323 [Hyphomicrobiaceae bacterium]|jgi:hypothetical protein
MRRFAQQLHRTRPTGKPRSFTYLLLLTTLLPGLIRAQTAAARPDLGEPAAVPDGAPPGIELIDRFGLRDHAYWLADDARNGRQTASSGQIETADYVAKHFKALGLKPLGDKRGFMQHYPIERLEISKSTGLRFGRTNLTDGFAVLHASDSDKLSTSGTLKFCGNGTEISGSMKGRIPVIVLSGKSRGGVGGDLQAIQRYTAIAAKLKKTDAKAGVVCLLDDQGSLANTLNYRGLLRDHGVMAYDKFARPVVRLPLMVLSTEASRKLLAHMKITINEGGELGVEDLNVKAKAKLTMQVKTVKKARASNVVAVLEGTNKKSQAIVISAHHDHVGTRLDGDRFNGADDNASGTSGLLELAEAFSKADKRPARSIIFLSVSGEELGLWGSAWYADHPTWPKDRITANINIDMIGRAGRKDQDILMQITPSHQHEKYSSLVREAVTLGKKFGVVFTSGDTYYRRSDHYNFAKKGIPVVFFCDGEHPDYHQVTDHADKLDYEAMEAIARLAYWTVWQTADAKGKPDELGKQPGW